MPFQKGHAQLPGAGRKKGQPNHSTADIKKLAFSHCADAIAELVRLSKHTNASIRLAASRELLDRGVGKAAQPVTGADGQEPVTVKHIVSWQKWTKEDYEAAEVRIAEVIDIASPHDAVFRHPAPEQVFDALGHAVDALNPRNDVRLLKG
jgi:hypothetical protein